MDRCPTCGSELVRHESLISVWYCSTGCGQCFQDLNLSGAASRIAGAVPPQARASSDARASASATGRETVAAPASSLDHRR
jgi:ribosomal protein L37AE/L43A